MSETADLDDLLPAPSAQLIERKVALDGRALEFPLERWLVSPDLIVGRWVADKDPSAINRYPRAGGFTSWGIWWPGRPYSAYRLHQPNGDLRLYRLDTIDQVVFDGERIEFHDLLLDALIRSDGEVVIEDEDEVEQAIADGRLNLAQRWRIDWTRDLYTNRAALLMERIDRAVDQAIGALRNGVD